jgi:hypothetical protein
MMRTTIDIPDDLLEAAKSVSRDRHQSLGQTVADLMRRGMQAQGSDELSVSPVTGLTVVDLGRPITSEDVRALDDEE